MATILEFRAANAGRATSCGSVQTGSAELIFFPGVRYERAEPAPSPRTRGKRSQNQHDRMDLPGDK